MVAKCLRTGATPFSGLLLTGYTEVTVRAHPVRIADDPLGAADGVTDGRTKQLSVPQISNARLRQVDATGHLPGLISRYFNVQFPGAIPT